MSWRLGAIAFLYADEIDVVRGFIAEAAVAAGGKALSAAVTNAVPLLLASVVAMLAVSVSVAVAVTMVELLVSATPSAAAAVAAAVTAAAALAPRQPRAPGPGSAVQPGRRAGSGP